MMRVAGIWTLKRDCDFMPMDLRKYGEAPHGDPFGHWSKGGIVEPKY